MKRPLITTAIISILAISCTEEFTDKNNSYTTPVSITGDCMYTFGNNGSRAETIEKLSENDSIIFSSSGGIIADRDTLIYKNAKWTGLKSKKWESNNERADYCAIHPVLEEYDEKNLYYSNNELKDIICCKSTEDHGNEINLSFHHIFAKMQINIDNELNSTIQEIRITIPQSVESINTLTGEVTINKTAKNISLKKNETARYEIFIPEGENQNIPFEIITTEEETHRSTISHSNYKSGYKYICNVKYNNGIYTKDDFIAFTHLINGYEYNGRSLDEFYIMKDGKRVFNLFADVEFTKEDMKKIKIIGSQNNKFNDIFDGNNHTISGLYFDSSIFSPTHIGIFQYISKNSVIRNLNIANSTVIETTNRIFSTACFIVGYNEGTIDNCRIKSGLISVASNTKDVAAICSLNKGYIINCSIESLNINDDGARIGGISSVNNGYILNCLVNSNIEVKNKRKEVSAICRLNNMILENIYTYKYSPYNYIFERVGGNNINTHIFFNRKYYGDKPLNDDYILHNDTPEDYTTNTEQLNIWIETTGKEKYPEINFKRWETDGSSAPGMI